MRARKKLTPDEKVALALDVLKESKSLHEICEYYQVSHTTAYSVRNAFLEGGRRALVGDRDGVVGDRDTVDRLRVLEEVVARHDAMIERGGRRG
jgi:transposase-like protein